MKRCVIVLMAVLLLLTGCHMVSKPEPKESVSPVEQETTHALPPKSISLYSLGELNEIKAIINAKNESAIQKAVHQYGLESSDDIKDFLEIIDSLPILKLFDGDVIYIGYQWPLSINSNGNENRSTAPNNLGIAYVTIQAEDGSWFRVNYRLSHKNRSKDDILESSDKSTSLLQTPVQALNERCLVYHETRAPHSTDSGEVITWLAVVDGIPVMIKYYSENAEVLKAETVFKKAIIDVIR